MSGVGGKNEGVDFQLRGPTTSMLILFHVWEFGVYKGGAFARHSSGAWDRKSLPARNFPAPKSVFPTLIRKRKIGKVPSSSSGLELRPKFPFSPPQKRRSNRIKFGRERKSVVKEGTSPIIKLSLPILLLHVFFPAVRITISRKTRSVGRQLSILGNIAFSFNTLVFMCFCGKVSTALI